MTTPTPPKFASYDHVESVIDPRTGHPRQTNEAGEVYPHATEGFWRSSFEDQARQIPQHLHRELLEWARVQNERMRQAYPVPSAHPVAQPAADAQKADTVATRYLSKTSSHSFAFKGKSIQFKTFFGRKSAQGVSHGTPLHPHVWKEMETLVSKYLERIDEVTSLDSSHILKVGYEMIEDDAGSNKAHFVVYTSTDGLVERKYTPVEDTDLEKLQDHITQYPALAFPKFNPLDERSNSLKGAALESSLAFPTLTRHMRNDTHTLNPIYKGIFSEAVKKARKQSQETHLSYSYLSPKLFTSEEELIDALNTPLDHFTPRDQIHIADASSSLKKNEARIYYGIEPRAGAHPDTLESEALITLAQDYPVIFVANASLGHLDKEKAPRTVHFEDVLIKTQKGSWLPSHTTAFLTKTHLRDLKLQEAPQETFEATILKLVLSAKNRYLKIRDEMDSQPEIVIHEPIDANGMSKDEISIQFFVSLITQMMLNSEAGDAAQIKLHFEYPNAGPEVKLALRDIMDEVSNKMQTPIHQGYREGNPMTVSSLIDLFCEQIEIGVTPPEDDAASISSDGSDEYADAVEGDD